MEKTRALLSRFGPLPPSIERYSRTMNTPLMYGLEWAAELHLIEKNGPNQEYDRRAIKDQAREKVIAFVQSDAMSETPANVIASLMYAALECTPPLREKPLMARRGFPTRK
jgi:hypothetical protein